MTGKEEFSICEQALARAVAADRDPSAGTCDHGDVSGAADVPFRLLCVDRMSRVPDLLMQDVQHVGALVALETGADADTGREIDCDEAVGILIIHPDECAVALLTPDQADALAATLRLMAADARAAAFNSATDALRKAARR